MAKALWLQSGEGLTAQERGHRRAREEVTGEAREAWEGASGHISSGERKVAEGDGLREAP